MHGFKSVESAQNLINERLLLLRVGDNYKEAMKLKRRLQKGSDFRPITPYRMPLQLYYNDATELRATDVPLELLIPECKKLGLTIHKGYALTPNVANKVKTDRRALAKSRRNKKVRLKMDSFIDVKDLSVEQLSNLSAYCNFERRIRGQIA